ncbi:MAG: thioredoxin family protein [Candidatus Helarchaeota archaeon]
MVKEVMEDEFKNLIKEYPLVLVDYSAVWCGPCQFQHQELKKLEEKLDNVKIVSIDIDKNMKMAQNLKIHAVPTLQFYKNGELVIFKKADGEYDRLVGLRSAEELEKIINEL